MNEKSIEFVKYRINNGYCKGMKNNEYNSFQELNPIKNIEQLTNIKIDNDLVKYVISFNDNHNVNRSTDVIIKYNENAEFDYFTMETVICDGTLYFFQELIDKVLYKVITCNTSYTENLTEDILNNLQDYKIVYIIGSLVLTSEYNDKFAPKDKPWMKGRFSVMLPIKIEYIKRRDK